MNSDLYKKLVDLYAAGELTEGLEESLNAEAFSHPDLAHDMTTLRSTVEALRNAEAPEFTEESYQRILMKLYFRGADIQPHSPDPAHLQYRLPMTG